MQPETSSYLEGEWENQAPVSIFILCLPRLFEALTKPEYCEMRNLR